MEPTIIRSFRRDKIIRYFRRGELRDTIPRLNPNSPKDMRTLETWLTHFEYQNDGYIVTLGKRKGRDGCYYDNVTVWTEYFNK